MSTSFCPGLLLESGLIVIAMRLPLLARETLLNTTLLLTFQFIGVRASYRFSVWSIQPCLSLGLAAHLAVALLSFESFLFTSRSFNVADFH